MDKKSETFTYTYSSAQQEEIRAIRKKYTAPEEQTDKMAQLRKLDAAVTRRAAGAAISLGAVFALIMGFGMSLVMTDLGAKLGMDAPMIPGIVTGLLGLSGVAGAYPLHRRILKRERVKMAPRILKLAEELS